MAKTVSNIKQPFFGMDYLIY